MMEETFAKEIETARRTLLENCDSLEQIANYCEDNYVKVSLQFVALYIMRVVPGICIWSSDELYHNLVSSNGCPLNFFKNKYWL